ncbi:MAG: YafY family transcriptional regulator [Anaerolineales bacterium]|nr:YafY family transcriptional regulator [Anaerolineales bacterium]
MRADRLLSILMLLQKNGRMSARALSDETAVSERTIYRDIDALCAAGVPIYSEPGVHGGYALVDSYRTTLTGLTEGEVRALFMLTIPAPLDDLGVSDTLRSAFLKLSAALPDVQRRDEIRVRQRFHLDATGWQQGGHSLPHLQTIYQAVWSDCKVEVTLRFPFATEVTRRIAPYGLVAKAGVWHLVCARHQGMRVYRVADLVDVRLLDETFVRPADFDLAAFWQAWCAERKAGFASYTAVLRIAPTLIPHLQHTFGRRIQQKARAASPDAAGWITLELTFASFFAAREKILAWGSAVVVVEPAALRMSVQDFAAQIVALYKRQAVQK